MQKNNLITGAWNLTDLDAIPKNGLKVMSCFSCGGGSTMGYKLAGYDVLGCVEIDPQMLEIYRANHAPKYPYLMGVQEFKNIPDADLPKEFFDLDILDGSPPCSSFSMSGSREKKWGSASKFREGQAVQNLDDLFFDFIDVAKKLQPRVVVAENVKGMLMGNARGYVKQIFERFKEAGYHCQLFLLNASFMGVPQRRERTVFIANRIAKKITFNFNEKQISIKDAIKDCTLEGQRVTWLTPDTKKLWEKVKPGEPLSKAHPKGHRFNAIKVNPNRPTNTMAASGDSRPIHWAESRRFTAAECLRVQTFPDDYKCKQAMVGYVCGMSVPPFMMHRIADQIQKQFFS
jgi:DNA (cytosine-5)-methyltransferase 1